MSVRIVPARSGKGYEYDVRLTWPEGGRLRERGKIPVSGKDNARRWAEARERVIAAGGKAAYVPLSVQSAPVEKPKGITFADFWPRVVRDHYRANRKKPSTIDAAESIYRVHLAPALGDRPLAEISFADVAAQKGVLADAKPKTVNNVLSVLSKALHCAVRWGVLPAMPCRVELLKTSDPSMAWYEREDYRRLVDEAGDRRTRLLILLAGSAGLRRGEIRALKWTDVDLPRKHIRVERALWRKEEGTTKGGRYRIVPMTDELAAVLREHRHLGGRVLCGADGEELSNRTIRNWLARAQKRAHLDANGGIHILRHTFCSHLAAAGVPAKAIQELAGHSDLKTTIRYMHLSPGDRDAAVAILSRYYAGSSVGGRRTEKKSA